jgi:hypothetical protein
VTAGIWFDPSHIWALEGDGFWFERKPVQASFFNQPNFVAVPYMNFQTGAQAAYQVNVPGASTGGASVADSNQLWGAESNLVLNTKGLGGCKLGLGLSFLAGFRYLDFSESTAIDTFNIPAGSLTTTYTNDLFRTRNQFYGGQVGTRFTANIYHVFFAAQAKIAFGDEEQSTDTLGTTVTSTPGVAPTSVPAGLLALPSNELRFHRERFAYVPEVEARIGYQFTPHFSIWAGYTLLYWNDVLRSAQQIDSVVDVRQSPVLGGATGPTGAQFPAVLFRETSLWAQGINLGFEYIY